MHTETYMILTGLQNWVLNNYQWLQNQSRWAERVGQGEVGAWVHPKGEKAQLCQGLAMKSPQSELGGLFLLFYTCTVRVTMGLPHGKVSKFNLLHGRCTLVPFPSTLTSLCTPARSWGSFQLMWPYVLSTRVDWGQQKIITPTQFTINVAYTWPQIQAAAPIGQVHVYSDASYLALLSPQRHTTQWCMYQVTCNLTTKVWLNVTRRLYLQ